MRKGARPGGSANGSHGFLLLLVLLSMLLVSGSCASHRPALPIAGGEPARLRISGSDTMLILTRRWAEEYMRDHPREAVYVWGGGTGRGLDDLIHQRVDLAAASRPPQPEEVRQIAQRFGSVGVSFAVAKEALSIYVHPSNPVRDLSTGQLRAIFCGRIRNWNELGGRDAPILVLRRPTVSGTYLYLKEHVLSGEDYAATAEVVQNNPGMVERVSGDVDAIGYGGIAYGHDLHCRVNGIVPDESSVRDGSYPITRYLYLISESSPTGAARRFVDWAQGPRGQEVVRRMGFVSLW